MKTEKKYKDDRCLNLPERTIEDVLLLSIIMTFPHKTAIKFDEQSLSRSTLLVKVLSVK